MLIYFYHQLRPLLDAGQVSVIRAPLFEMNYRQTLASDAPIESRFAYTDDEARNTQRELTLAGVMNLKTKRMCGLGGMPSELLRSTCVVPETRHAFRLGPQDAEAAIAVFGG